MTEFFITTLMFGLHNYSGDIKYKSAYNSVNPTLYSEYKGPVNSLIKQNTPRVLQIVGPIGYAALIRKSIVFNNINLYNNVKNRLEINQNTVQTGISIPF